MLTIIYKIVMMWSIPFSSYYYYKDSEVLGVKNSYWSALKVIWESYWRKETDE